MSKLKVGKPRKPFNRLALTSDEQTKLLEMTPSMQKLTLLTKGLERDIAKHPLGGDGSASLILMAVIIAKKTLSSELSREMKLMVAVALDRADLLVEMNFTMAEAIEEIGPKVMDGMAYADIAIKKRYGDAWQETFGA